GVRSARQRETVRPRRSASRPLLEVAIRERVRALPNVTMLDGHDVAGLCASATAERITGATVTGRTGRRTVQGEIVVDAPGRGSRPPRWRAELGYEPPQADRVLIDLSYSTGLFE